MGKKRTRVPGEPRASSKTELSNGQHKTTLEDVVREQRDVQFALEKKQTERAKRRRMEVEREEGDSKNGKLQTHQPLKASARKDDSKRIDARATGLQMWRNAARRRNEKVDIDDEDNTEGEGEGGELVGVDGKTEKKIIEEARQQRSEIRKENEKLGVEGQNNDFSKESRAVDEALRTLAVVDDDSDNDGHRDDGDVDDGRSVAGDTEYDWRSTVGEDERDLEFLDGSKVTEADELALSLFGNPEKDGTTKGVNKDNKDDDNEEGEQNDGNGGGKVMLVDIILQKIEEREEASARAAALAADPEKAERDRKIAEVYELVGNIMAKYRSGKVPKAFKIIPKVRNWEELLYLTRPDEWSPAGVYVATRLLASNLSGKQVVPFYTDILLPRCLEDITTNKKLNVHLYRALVKAVYKPDAFCKGILFPLCDEGACTLRQATIISSVVAKVSIPMLHSAAALLYMCYQCKFNVTVCLLVTALLEKKYALPYRVLDAAVEWFVRMKEDERELPLIWHKCLLSLAQRYKMELTLDQKEKLKLLMRVHTHKLITPEIRRELFSARNRGDVMDPDANTIAKNIANAAAMKD